MGTTDIDVHKLKAKFFESAKFLEFRFGIAIRSSHKYTRLKQKTTQNRIFCKTFSKTRVLNSVLFFFGNSIKLDMVDSV